ncbi:hypothetical protein BH20GEM3_BH20GEM3_11730 [soil metagenome]|jgi:hypothetical protein|nr:hypothetical protein [Gemmatimonadota bacterium]MDQ3521072.1 hypothetical protein [Gemmatimonadota bacterium]
MEQEQGAIHRVEITDEEGVTWAVRHQLSDRAKTNRERVSQVEFSAGERRLRGRIAGGSRVGADTYKAVLEDAKRMQDESHNR